MSALRRQFGKEYVVTLVEKVGTWNPSWKVISIDTRTGYLCWYYLPGAEIERYPTLEGVTIV